MKRLTKKELQGDYIFINGENSCPNELATKFGELEDIEEELGIELIAFLKASFYGIYTKDCYSVSITNYPRILSFNKKWDISNCPRIFNFNKKELCFYNEQEEHGGPVVVTDRYYLKDYGKTWALTKEELESKV